jgi:hypothetical protein
LLKTADIKNRNFFLVLVVPIFGAGRPVQKSIFWCRLLKMTDTNNAENISRSNIFRSKIEKHGTLSPKKRGAEETRRAQAESWARSSLSLHTVSLSTSLHLSSCPSLSFYNTLILFSFTQQEDADGKVGCGVAEVALKRIWDLHDRLSNTMAEA